MLAFVYRWQVVIPLAGMGVCVSVMLGCKLLMHPGVVRSRNNPLTAMVLAAGLICGVLVVLFLAGVLRGWLARRSCENERAKQHGLTE